MAQEIDETHDPKLESWVESANDPETDFPIQNLPIGRCYVPLSTRPGYESDSTAEHIFINTLVVPIGDRLLDLAQCAEKKLLIVEGVDQDDLTGWFDDHGVAEELHLLDSMPSLLDRLRKALHRVLSVDGDLASDAKSDPSIFVKPLDLPPLLGSDCANYTDFYASLFHATNVGSMFRPDNPILPNYKHIPIAYHGRASSIVASGTEIVRPWGQLAPAVGGIGSESRSTHEVGSEKRSTHEVGSESRSTHEVGSEKRSTRGIGSESRPTHEIGSESQPTFGPCKLLDYELEVGVVVGRGNEMGERVSIGDAEGHILGLCLVNDWSARDMQKWEYQPLGPFLAKSFATTVSPYIVTMEALAPFRTPAFERPAGDPQPLGYLDSAANRAGGGFDITLEVYIASEQMRKRGMSPMRLSKGTFKDMYWTIAQMLTHHTSNGCNLQPGDLLASGTVSGATRDSRGCLLELTWDGDAFADPPVVVPGTQRTPIELPTGETRKFLADGDEVILKGYCEREGFRRIGFGECRGVVKPART